MARRRIGQQAFRFGAEEERQTSLPAKVPEADNRLAVANPVDSPSDRRLGGRILAADSPHAFASLFPRESVGHVAALKSSSMSLSRPR